MSLLCFFPLCVFLSCSFTNISTTALDSCQLMTPSMSNSATYWAQRKKRSKMRRNARVNKKTNKPVVIIMLTQQQKNNWILGIISKIFFFLTFLRFLLSKIKKGKEEEETRRGRVSRRGTSICHQNLCQIFPWCNAACGEEEASDYWAAECATAEGVVHHCQKGDPQG